MRIDLIADRLARFPAALRGVIACFPDDDLAWRPPDGAWTAHEISLHLLLEEQTDFPVRLRLTLERPEEPWPPLDPEALVREAAPDIPPVAQILDEFDRCRAASVRWLRSLPEGVDWSVRGTTPRGARVAAADLLASWPVHDALHLRQLSKRLVQLSQRDAPGADTGYAGA